MVRAITFTAARTHDKMQQKIRIATRVGRVRLIFTLALMAMPALALTDRTADARVPSVDVPARVAPVTAESATMPSTAASVSAFDMAGWEAAELGSADPKVVSLALHAAEAAVERGDADRPATLTVIDFSRPSTSKRMWVYDLRTRTMLFEEFVAHGRNSGHNLTTAFSNQPESHKSSLDFIGRPKDTSASTATHCGSTASKRASTIARASGRSSSTARSTSMAQRQSPKDGSDAAWGAPPSVPRSRAS
jgi:hypothetical protein